MKKRFLPFFVLIFFSLAHAEVKVPSVKRAPKIGPNTKINFDFTKMNYNMATGIIFDMMIDPETYKNKTAKIKGQFATEVHDILKQPFLVLFSLRLIVLADLHHNHHFKRGNTNYADFTRIISVMMQFAYGKPI